jgi:hypothetical protein
MKVGDYVYDPEVLTPGKDPGTHKIEAGWASQPDWEKYFASAGIRAPIMRPVAWLLYRLHCPGSKASSKWTLFYVLTVHDHFP